MTSSYRQNCLWPALALIEKLGVKGQQVNLSLTSVNSRENADVEVVALEEVAANSGMGKTSVIQLPKVYALPNLHTPESCIASASDAIKWPHLKDLRLPRVEKSGVSILIGRDVPEALWPLELREGEKYNLMPPRLAWGGPTFKVLPSRKKVCRKPFSNKLAVARGSLLL